MKIIRVNYKKKYADDASRMMAKTWKYHEMMEGKVDELLMYKLFFEYYHSIGMYVELAANEKDELVGLLIAGSTKQKVTLKSLIVVAKALFAFLQGKLGKRLGSTKDFDLLFADMKKLMKDRVLYDQEITLFFIDEKCRGMGIGRQMMDNYMRHARKQNIKNVILMTDAGCNYKFYDIYGFERINAIHSEYFVHQELALNGFAYGYTINAENV